VRQERAIAVQVRVGVNTGEVVTCAGTEGQRIVVGDPINVAVRLEQAARPGEILLGETTSWLVRDAVKVTTHSSLELPGRRESVRAYRLETITGREAHERAGSTCR
jgi:class 3 adenylate cyclase